MTALRSDARKALKKIFRASEKHKRVVTQEPMWGFHLANARTVMKSAETNRQEWHPVGMRFRVGMQIPGFHPGLTNGIPLGCKFRNRNPILVDPNGISPVSPAATPRETHPTTFADPNGVAPFFEECAIRISPFAPSVFVGCSKFAEPKPFTRCAAKPQPCHPLPPAPRQGYTP